MQDKTPEPSTRTARRTSLTPSGERVTINVQINTSQHYFYTICNQLARKNKRERIRHLRTEEEPFTLRKLMNIGLQLNREVGLFLDTIGKPPAGR